MANYPYAPEDEDDDLSPEAAAPQIPSAFVPPQSPLANPVLKNFDTPAQAAVPTVPQQADPDSVPPPAPVQPRPQVKAAPAAQQPVQATPAQPADDNSADALVSMVGQGQSDDAAEEGRQQALRDQAATNKYQRAQGVQMAVSPTGQTAAARDKDGNVLYKAAVIQPFTRGDDGEAYRVSRDEYGTQHYFRIADGADEADYHTDPHTGEQYVAVSGADGGSKREIIGQNPIIPKLNGIETQLQGHIASRDEAQQTIAALTSGVAGADGLGSLSLEQLRHQASALAPSIKSAQQQFDTLEQWRQSGNTLTAPLLDQWRTANATLQRLAPQRDAVQSEIDAREQEMTVAHQTYNQSHTAAATAAQTRDVLRAARYGRGNIASDLATIASGGSLDTERAALLSKAGLLVQDNQDDGSTIMRIPQEAVGLLDPLTRKQVLANPTAFVVRPDKSPDLRPVVKQVQKHLDEHEPQEPESDADDKPTPAQRAFDELNSRKVAGAPLSGDEEQKFTRVARQSWVDSQRAILAAYPQVGVAGSPANLAFVQAFRQSGGDHRRAFRLARGLFQKSSL